MITTPCQVFVGYEKPLGLILKLTDRSIAFCAEKAPHALATSLATGAARMVVIHVQPLGESGFMDAANGAAPTLCLVHLQVFFLGDSVLVFKLFDAVLLVLAARASLTTLTLDNLGEADSAVNTTLIRLSHDAASYIPRFDFSARTIFREESEEFGWSAI